MKSYIIILFLILIPGVYAIGVSPSKTNINFHPNLNIEKYFKIINQENMNTSIKLSLSGELSKFIHLRNQTIKLNSNLQESKVYFRIKMPSTYSPGFHNAKITIVPILSASNGFSAILALNHNINLYVPKEYSQLLVNFTYLNRFLILYLENPRNETVNNLDLKVVVNDGRTNLTELNINNLQFQPQEIKKMPKRINPLKNGRYRILYSSSKFNFSNVKEMIIGKRNINFKILPHKWLSGQINKIPINIENIWNKNTSVNVKMVLRKAAKPYTSSKKTITLLPYEKKNTNLYLESQDVDSGNYTLSFQLSFNGQTKQIEKDINLQNPILIKPNENSISKLKMSALIMTLTLLGILLYLIWRKK